MGRVAGHRGRTGELTVRVGGEAALWTGVRRFWIEGPRERRFCEVEHSRAYRDRLVLKLKGIDDADQAARLRGCGVFVAWDEVPVLSGDLQFAGEIVGMLVIDESGQEIGRVEGLLETGGTDVLRVRTAAARSQPDEGDGGELLVPWAREYVLSVDPAARRIVTRLPEELRRLNHPS